ncbi:MAG: 1-deoxy-D-xylulose-5-phosphate reductoisomerase [Acidobacteria bacterium]|nr:1-deoxy-D-xylulose-5-phosphate reductoisomerase [Acidobacteriota bacterium]
MVTRNLTLLGSTGSIGRSVLDVIRFFPDRFRVSALAAGRNIDLLCDQIRQFHPRVVTVADARCADRLRNQLGELHVDTPEIFYGTEGAILVATLPDVQMVLGAISGAAGLVPSYEAVRAGKMLALANKETLVMAGDLMMSLAVRSGSAILPVDSEHNALHQCLQGIKPEHISTLILTASGGPFLNLPPERIATATVQDALQHPTWRMGKKITIDSATLMNKGLEIIEAHHLFAMPPEKIEVLIHPQSVVHSMVRTLDGSLIAQMGITDMRLPILYALTYPERLSSPLPALDLTACGPLHFQQPEMSRFPCLKLAYDALRSGRSMPVVLNAANEVAVSHFLQEQIPFGAIPTIIERAISEHSPVPLEDLDQILDIDAETRVRARLIIEKNIRTV